MANTYTSLHYHVVFSTKHRARLIGPAMDERVWSYLGGIARENDMTPLCIGGVEDHVHLLLGLPATLAVSKAVQLIKGGASKWVETHGYRHRVAPRQVGRADEPEPGPGENGAGGIRNHERLGTCIGGEDPGEIGSGSTPRGGESVYHTQPRKVRPC